MPSIPLPGSTFTFSIPLVSQADSHVFQAAPTIAAGDFKRSINNGAFANMDNLPAVTPTGGKLVQIVVSASETTAAGEGGTIDIIGSDAAGAEWDDIGICLRVGVITANAAQISGDAVAADNAEAFFDGTGYAGTGNTIPTVTTLTNMPAAAPSAATIAAEILVTPANKLATGASGVASANVTLWKGEIPGDLDASGNVMTKLAAQQGPVEFVGQVKITANVAGPAAGVLDIRNSGTGNAVYMESQSADTVDIEQKTSHTASGIKIISHGTGVWISADNDNGVEIASSSAEGVSIIGYQHGIYVSGEAQPGIRVDSNALNKAAVLINHYGNAGQGLVVQSLVNGEGIKIDGAGAFHDLKLAGDGVLDGTISGSIGGNVIGKVLGGGVDVFVDDGVQVAATVGGLTAQQTADAVNNLAPVGTPAVGSIGSHLDLILNGLTGVGLLPLIYTVTVTGTATPIEGVTVEVYTEEACINCVRRGTTNSFGVVTFWFTTPGTYWLRREKDGVAFVNPDSETVSV